MRQGYPCTQIGRLPADEFQLCDNRLMVITGSKLIAPVAVLAAIPLGIIAYRIQIHDIPQPASRAAAIVTVAGMFVAAGAVAWRCRSGNLLGLLMMAAGLALLLRQLRYSHDALVFTVFFALGELGFALACHSALAYPFGAVRDRAGRALLKVGYAVASPSPWRSSCFMRPALR